MPAARISAAVAAAAPYGTVGSAVPSNMSVGESARSKSAFASDPGSAPEIEIAAPTFDEYPGLPLVPGSVELTATARAVAAPAEPPPMATRLGSMPYVAAFRRRQPTAACASCCAVMAAVMQFCDGAAWVPHFSFAVLKRR